MSEKPILVFLNTVGVFLLLFFVLIYLWIIEGKKKEAISVIFSALVAGTLSIILKELFGEPRPFIMDGLDPKAGLASLSSFPSFHASLAFATATSVAFHKRWFGVLVLVGAILIGIGRIVANVHYPADIIFGVIVGVLVASTFEKVKFKV